MTISANTAIQPAAGHSAKLYMDTSTNSDTPTWTEVKGIGDVNLEGFERANVEIKSRDYDYTLSLPGIAGVPAITFNMFHGFDPTTQAAIQNDYLGKTRRKWLVCDGDCTQTGAEGWIIPGYVSQLGLKQGLEEAQSYDVRVTGVLMKNQAGTSNVEVSYFVKTSG